MKKSEWLLIAAEVALLWPRDLWSDETIDCYFEELKDAPSKPVMRYIIEYSHSHPWAAPPFAPQPWPPHLQPLLPAWTSLSQGLSSYPLPERRS
jgi:hypothetical protein